MELMAMRRNIITLVCLVLLSLTALSQDRWLFIGTDVRGISYFLDLQTIEKLDSERVIYWEKKVNKSGTLTLQTRITMWKANRTYQVISEPNCRVDDIRPESMEEAFYKKLFGQPSP